MKFVASIGTLSLHICIIFILSLGCSKSPKVPPPPFKVKAQIKKANPILLKIYPRIKKKVAHPDLMWLARCVYFEARGQSKKGQIAVASVILARVKSPNFPNDIVSVVQQKNQFSWYWDGKPDTVFEQDIFLDIYTMCSKILSGEISLIIKKSLYYHNTSIFTPNWATSLSKVATIGNHIFYK